MTFALLALPLLAGPQVWTSTEGLSDASPPCSAESLAAAIQTQRPGVVARAWRAEDGAAPPASSIHVSLVRRDSGVVLEVLGPGKPVVRTMDTTEDCERDIATAALIVDRALDEVVVSPDAPKVGSLAPPVPLRRLLHASIAAGAGVSQGAFGFAPSFEVEGELRYRFLRLSVDVDAALATSTSFTLTSPEQGGGTFSAVPLSFDLGAGVAPRLGPGRVVVEALVGGVLVFASASSPQTFQIFQQQPATATQPFGGLRLGYDLDLPFGLFVGLHAEERLSPRARFQVVGATFTGGTDVDKNVALTPTWSFVATGLFGVHFL